VLVISSGLRVQVVSKGQVAYLVDIAKADALDVLGDARQALKWWIVTFDLPTLRKKEAPLPPYPCP